MDLEFGDEVSRSQDSQPNTPKPNDSANRKRPIRSVTPQQSSLGKNPIKRGRLNGIDTPLTFNESPKDPLGLISLVDRIPTKEDRDHSERLAAQTQENLTTNITAAMSQILTTNRSNELATKAKIASNEIQLKIEEMNLKNRLARSQMVMELIRCSMAPSEAEAMALRQLPDIKMPQQSHQPTPDSNLESGSSI
ncbi:hypothetical protein DFH28DRAFT_911732 [Melampsora americana]|nr:hypothetical protein DFH28DRAFT_911732 [Melampsora americana]